MKRLFYQLLMPVGIIIMVCSVSSCKKTMLTSDAEPNNSSANAKDRAIPNFNLEVILRGNGKAFGLVKFRQDVNPTKIVTLDTWVRDLLPNHSYKLQRAIDTNLDGNCTGTNWLTLGKGPTSQLIYTDENGTGREDLWRKLTAQSGTKFDIHFRVIDASSSSVVVVLTSDCYQFTVR